MLTGVAVTYSTDKSSLRQTAILYRLCGFTDCAGFVVPRTLCPQEMDLSGGASQKPWYCYMLQTCDGRACKTYVGATVDPDRRLRQHNGELAGGARATHGRRWQRAFLVGGFADERAALRFEWRWKYLTRQAPGLSWLERRMHALSLLLADFPWAQVLEPKE
jgi:predicted GIY-YIG superfamily endonuclease